MKALKITAEPRSALGSSAVGRLRRKGAVPAILYGSGKKPRPLTINLHDFEQGLKGHAGEHLLIDLEVAGEPPVKALIKEVQHHPVTGKILHVDFNEVSMTRKLRVRLPIHFVGIPIGVSQQGGLLESIIREVEVECLPGDIPEYVEVDVSGLAIGQSLTIGDIRLDPTRFTIVSNPSLAIATVAAPRVEEEAAPAAEAAAAAAAAEPEVIREKKPTEEEAAEAEKGEEAEKKEEPRKTKQ